MAKIQLSQRMYSIRDINRLLKSGELTIQPKYQRRRTAWPLSAKTALIDTMLNNFPVPPVYLRDYVDSTGRRQKEIIDGQQRISTFIEFFNDDFALSKNIFDTDLAGHRYSELPGDEKLMIEDFEVSFIAIRGASDSDIISIFARLNSFSLPLNNQEKRNSLYAGEIKSIIYELASEYNTFWVEKRILSEAQISRMADALLVSEIIDTTLNGYRKASNAYLNEMYSNFEEDYPYKEETYRYFNQVMTILGNLFESKQIGVIFKAKFMFYSLFLVVYARLFGFEGMQEEKTGKVDIETTRINLEDFCKRFSDPSFDPRKRAKFKQATGNSEQRKFRHKEIKALLV